MRTIHLRAAREKAGLTQVQLAEAVGVTQGTISKWENDPDAKPSFDQHVDLAKAVDVDPHRLRFGLSNSEAVAS